MPLTTQALEGILYHMTAKRYIYLASDPSFVIQTGQFIGDHPTRIKAGGIDFDFGRPEVAGDYGFINYDPSYLDIVGATAVATSINDINNDPLVFVVEGGTTIHRIVITNRVVDEQDRVIQYIIDIPSGQRPTFTNDGAYYINQIKFILQGQ